MRTEVAATRLRVTPEQAMILEVGVTNTSDVIDGVTAVVHGLDAEWIQLVQPVVSLFPETSGTIQIRINVPRTCLAGEYAVTVEVISVVDDTRRTTHDCWVSVAPVQAAALELRPSVVIAGKTAEFDVVLTNEGNIATDLSVTAIDQTRSLTCAAEPGTVLIPATETRAVTLYARGPRPFFGSPVTRTIDVTAANGEIELTGTATFTQKPRIPRGVLTILILASIIALWAFIFLRAIDFFRDTPDPKKAVGTLLLVTSAGADGDGAGAAGAQVDLAIVGGSMTGSVVAENSGAPLPRITVEALRLRRGQLVTVGSAATDDDGVFSFDAVLPGTYKLRFSADGFEEIWYPAAADQGSAEELRLAPGGELADRNVEMVGLPGTFRGEIVAPEGVGGAPVIDVSVVEVIEDPVEGEPAPAPVEFSTDGPFELGALVTPAVYEFTVSSDGFETTTFQETLGGGQTKVINTVTLGAGPGSISGTVTSGGTAKGGVKVTLRSGETVKETTTPTSGDIGAFRFEELVTPATYTLTFELDGFSSQSIALDLASGENRARDVALSGGAGSISGRAVDAQGNPLGGVEVTVREGEFTATSATLTDGAGSAAGTYSIADLPTPGAYTVTFTLAGFESQTVLVLLGDAASQTGIDATMVSSTGSVAGTVTVDGQPRGDLEIELSDGLSPRTTLTATSPAGAFEFGGVAPGTYTITVRRPGLPPRVVLVTVAPGERVERTIDVPGGG